jgi:hypothetical protein
VGHQAHCGPAGGGDANVTRKLDGGPRFTVTVTWFRICLNTPNPNPTHVKVTPPTGGWSQPHPHPLHNWPIGGSSSQLNTSPAGCRVVSPNWGRGRGCGYFHRCAVPSMLDEYLPTYQAARSHQQLTWPAVSQISNLSDWPSGSATLCDMNAAPT